MTPAECVIDTFGGIRATARAADVQPSTVCRWLKPRSEGGTGGFVPPAHADVLLAKARELHKLLTEEHLRIGRPGINRRVIRRL